VRVYSSVVYISYATDVAYRREARGAGLKRSEHWEIRVSSQLMCSLCCASLCVPKSPRNLVVDVPSLPCHFYNYLWEHIYPRGQSKLIVPWILSTVLLHSSLPIVLLLYFMRIVEAFLHLSLYQWAKRELYTIQPAYRDVLGLEFDHDNWDILRMSFLEKERSLGIRFYITRFCVNALIDLFESLFPSKCW
jgi:hypothetical protein